MTSGSPRIRRLLPTSFTLKDVAVVITAAVTAASPFFAFDAKFEAVEDKYTTMQGSMDEVEKRNQLLIEQVITLTTRVQYLEESRRQSAEERARLNQAVIELQAAARQRR